MRQPGEPSVEDILESIKQVIARDNRAGTRSTRSRSEPFTPEAPATATPAQAAPAVPDPEDVLDLAASAAFISDDEDDEATENGLIPPGARASMRESLAALAMLAEPGASPQIVRSGETSLEGLTRDLLRPMLAEWLDKNLPPLVERLVAAEIARIVGKKG
ncbi:DUF2497 domain-containing protein [Novosphingobium sp. 9]|uniref:DUF2497 domain-containing protein n=1 Tax=Novosphingobium sp. 9 TaxID=2025349 RepID=UPI0021B582D0|nr:DUF2497 domain-containing protein [Novosphingobium sp. 9]